MISSDLEIKIMILRLHHCLSAPVIITLSSGTAGFLAQSMLITIMHCSITIAVLTMTYFHNILMQLNLIACIAPSNAEGVWALFKANVLHAIKIFVPRQCNESKELLIRHPYNIQHIVKHKQHLWHMRHWNGGKAHY